jgi:predicted SpoU family rRNA methylase
MKLEEIIKNVTIQYETKVKQVNQLISELDKAKIELQQLVGALQLAQEMKQLEDKEVEELALKNQPIQEVNSVDPE